MSSRDPREELEQLGKGLEPSPEEVAALIDGSLEADREQAPTYPLLAELPSPSSDEVRELKARVVAELEAPAKQPAWVPWAVGAAVMVAAAVGAWLIL